MAERQAELVHRHEAPKGFIWKYIFSLDHKVSIILSSFEFRGFDSVF